MYKFISLKNVNSSQKLLFIFILFTAFTVIVITTLHLVKKAPTIKSNDPIISGNYGVPEIIKLEKGQKFVSITSDSIKSSFEFNAIAPHWTEKPGSEGIENRRIFEIRTSLNNKDWGAWTDVSVDGPLKDNDPKHNEMFPEAPIFEVGNYVQFRVQIDSDPTANISPEISKIALNYIDSRENSITKITKKIQSYLSPEVYASEQGPTIITRANWGNPDPYGNLFKNTELEWEPSYTPVNQVFIHHTVNANASSDFPALMRGIWQYQTYTRGWGDIGYNYLIDGNGQIYEGRYGGENVVGGHVLGFNRGSVGIGLIGCFQPNNSTCTSLNGNNTYPSASLLNSLYNLIGWKSKNNEIDPRANHTFCGTPVETYGCKNLYTVTAHRDAGETACPGNNIYDLLPTIRDAAESRRANLFPYAAKQLTFSKVTSTSTGQTSVSMQFKNTGTTTWSNASPRMFLKTANPNDRNSTFQGNDWFTYQHIALLTETSVPPGGVGSFTFNIDAANKQPGEYFEGTRLVVEGVTEINSYYMLRIQAPTYKWSVLSINYSSKTAMMTPGQTQTITVSVKNTGTATWSKTGPNPLRFGTWSPDRQSAFYDSTWFNPERATILEENTVIPNDNGTFVFKVRAPNKLGQYSERFNIVAENRGWADDNGSQIYFHIVAPQERQSTSKSHVSETSTKADFDGDGFDDLFASSRRSDPAQNEIVFRSTGTWLGSNELWASTLMNEIPYSEAINTFADIDGDGKTDLLTITRADNDINPEIWYQRSTGTSFESAYMVGRPGLIAQNTRWTVGDIDGDGKDDLIAFSRRSDTATNIIVFPSQGTWLGAGTLYASPSETPFSSTNFIPADQNGDGKTDLYAIVQAPDITNPKIYLMRSNLNNFSQPVLTAVPGLKNGDVYFVAADINGDNMDDLVASSRRSDPAPNLIAFITDGVLSYQSINLWSYPSELRWAEMKIIPADLDNDGSVDLLITQRHNTANPAIYWLKSLGSQFDTAKIVGTPGLIYNSTRFAE